MPKRSRDSLAPGGFVFKGRIVGYGSSRQGCESRRVQVPLPSVARNGRLAYRLLGPKLAPHYDASHQALLAMPDDPKGQGVLSSLGVSWWEGVDQEEMEFMIDLMNILMVLWVLF